jgi:hypothetical protein
MPIALSGGYRDPDALSSGEATMPREVVLATTSLSTGTLRLSYFTAVKTETITQVRTYSGSAAAATPTLCKMGVYSVDASGNLTLLAATANDTALWAAANTTYTRSLTTSFTKVAGQRYAAAQLCVTAGTAPTVLCGSSGAGSTMNSIMADAPRLGGAVTAVADLSASIAAGSVGVQANRIFSILLP